MDRRSTDDDHGSASISDRIDYDLLSVILLVAFVVAAIAIATILYL